MSDVYYLHTDLDIKKLIVYFNDIQIKESKRNKYGDIIEGQTGKLIRDFIGLIGVDNIILAMNNLLANNKKLTNKTLKNELKIIYSKEMNLRNMALLK